jgi:hypothetical protein
LNLTPLTGTYPIIFRQKKYLTRQSEVWVTVVKLVLGAVILIGGVGLALWFAARDEMQGTASGGSSSDSWGITHDSPTRMKR